MKLTSYKSQLTQLFDKAKAENVPFAEREYALPEVIPDDSLLFIGLNPSFTKKAKKGSHFYPLEQDASGYFAKFPAIAEACGCKWSHLDLLGLRVTSQKEVLHAARHHPWFFQEHFDSITHPILAAVRPRAVIVVNAQARKYMGTHRSRKESIGLGYEFAWNDDHGTYSLTKGPENLKGVPFFFSGMLTGQRALDLGSYERLKWQVEKVVRGECATGG
ncbi:MAG: hypothetical protein AAF399_24485 [Bacteroidota bacterium]